jgi:GNAT superfamily N-acetyltransferase
MSEVVRLARKGEMERQKEIWKLCFGDSEQYIDYYYNYRYREEETAVLLKKGEIAAMLAMLPVKVVSPSGQSFDSLMIYALATHPRFQGRGYAAYLLDFVHQQMTIRQKSYSLVVPSGEELFDFYCRQGYQSGFGMRCNLFCRAEAEKHLPGSRGCCNLTKIMPPEYNQRREKLLAGRLHVAYSDRDITYQQKLCHRLGTDIYGLECPGEQGCLVIERINPEKVLIKELLIREEYIFSVLREIVRCVPAEEYIIRTPPFSAQQLGGTVNPFAMVRAQRRSEQMLFSGTSGYLGLAFD